MRMTVAEVGDIPEGEGRAYPAGNRIVAVFLKNGQYTAIDDACPHMGASLGAGYVDGEQVICPWHAWRFCIKSGAWMDNPGSKLTANSYPVHLEGRLIQVELPD